MMVMITLIDCDLNDNNYYDFHDDDGNDYDKSMARIILRFRSILFILVILINNVFFCQNCLRSLS